MAYDSHFKKRNFEDKPKLESNAQPLKSDWILDGINQEAVSWSQKFAEYLSPKSDFKGALTTSQLRKFFGQLKRIEADFEKLKSEIPLLKPKLAYAVGRAEKGNRIVDFYIQMETALNALDNSKNTFNNLINLTESIVAFHKFYGGK